MNHRSGELYVSQKVMRGLHLTVLKTSTDNGKASADKIADDALNEWLRKNHADIMDYIDRRADEDAAFMKSLSPNLPIP